MEKPPWVRKPRTSARNPARLAKQRAQTERRRPVKSPSRGSSARTAAKSTRPARIAKPAKAPVRATKLPQPVAPPAPAPPPVGKPTYHEAVAMSERGLQALQRRGFAPPARTLRAP